MVNPEKTFTCFIGKMGTARKSRTGKFGDSVSVKFTAEEFAVFCAAREVSNGNKIPML